MKETARPMWDGERFIIYLFLIEIDYNNSITSLR